MTLIESLTLAVALAMDCFSVCLAAALGMRHPQWRPIGLMAFFFGLFQALMPLLGWALTSRFRVYIEAFDHGIAFGLLAWLGVNMLLESRREVEQRRLDFSRLGTILLMAVATSVDALAVGVSFACMGMASYAALAQPILMIGVVSSLLSLLAFWMGFRGRAHLARRLRPEMLGGVILIGIGLKILVEHLSGNA